jgi:hypothetical protein
MQLNEQPVHRKVRLVHALIKRIARQESNPRHSFA